MVNFLSIIEKELSITALVDLAKSLNNSYEPFMQDYRVWKIIDAIFPEKIKLLLQPFKMKVVGHQIVNDLIMKYYPCEKVIKYHLVRKFLNRKDEVTVFEMNINTSRLDIGRINGNSFGYEIKTKLDKLTKLPKQLDDYSKVLEYIFVVTHEIHLNKIQDTIPEHCGILLYELKGKAFKVNEIKKPFKSPNIDTEIQIKSLASKDIDFILKLLGQKKTPTTRFEREKILYSIMSAVNFNELFKLALKNKFCERWSYLQSNFSQIQPIDAQLFFSSPADPYWVYYKNSSMV